MALAALGLAMASGCVSTSTSSYPGWRGTGFERRGPPWQPTARLRPVRDLRAAPEVEGGTALAWVPGVWDATRTLRRPEAQAASGSAATRFGFDPVADLGAALADELVASGLVGAIVEPPGRGPGGVTIGLEVLQTEVRLRQRTYGLSILAPLAWLFGAPSAHYEVAVALRLRLRGPQPEPGWERVAEATTELPEGLYSGEPVDLTADVVAALRGALLELLRALDAAEPFAARG